MNEKTFKLKVLSIKLSCGKVSVSVLENKILLFSNRIGLEPKKGTLSEDVVQVWEPGYLPDFHQHFQKYVFF